jgi:hypothetical protein
VKEEEIESKEQIEVKIESPLTEVGDLKSGITRPEPVDWKPQDKCYFCVDGKLLKVNEIGELVVETGPVQPEAELNKHVSANFNHVKEMRFLYNDLFDLIYRLLNRKIRALVLIQFRKITIIRHINNHSIHRLQYRKIWKHY